MKIHQSTLTNFRWVIVLATILILIFSTHQLITTGMRFFQSSSLLYVALGIIFLFFAWQWSENRLSRMPIEIIRESNQKPEHTPTNTTPLMKQQMTARFGYFNAITSIFAVVFVILVWVQLAVAGMNSERVVHVFWNEFGEYHIEVILFVLIGILIIINTVWSIKRLRA